MRSNKPYLLTSAGWCLLLCLLPGCGKETRTALANQLAAQNGASGDSGGSQADYSAFLPDASRTPGDTLPVTADDVCTPGYAGKVRNVNTEEKNEVYQEYGIAHHAPHEYEIDHLISLELGGSNNKKNLWPQSYLTQPWNAHVKDSLEDKLHEMVCTGQIDLNAAQRDIRTDWIAAYRRVFHTDQPISGGSSGAHRTRSRAGGVSSPHSQPDSNTESNTSNTESNNGAADKVWVNTRSGKYFQPGDRYYGNTREGEYLSEQEAIRQGYRAAGGQR